MYTADELRYWADYMDNPALGKPGGENPAATPELLTACIDTLTRLEWWEKDKENRCLDNTFAVLKCAIAKAERGVNEP